MTDTTQDEAEQPSGDIPPSPARTMPSVFTFLQRLLSIIFNSWFKPASAGPGQENPKAALQALQGEIIGWVNQRMAQAEMKAINDSLGGPEPTPEQKAKAEAKIKALESLPIVQQGKVSPEVLAAFKDLYLQGEGVLPHNPQAFESDLRVLGGDQAVTAYRELAQLKSTPTPAEPDKVKQATEALQRILQEHPNILLSMQHRSNGDMVPPQPAPIANPAQGSEGIPVTR